MSDINYVCIATAGSVDAGKSTTLGHLVRCGQNCSSVLDSKDDPLLTSIAKHPHEVIKGKTSDIGYKITKINEKIVVMVDLAGHDKYLGTTTRGLTAQLPDAGILMVSGNRGVLEMTKEHLMLFQQLNIPFMVNYTKEDISPIQMFKDFKRTFQKNLDRNRKPVFINYPMKIELKNSIKREHELKKKIEVLEKECEKMNDETFCQRKQKTFEKELSKYTNITLPESLNTKSITKLLLETIKEHYKYSIGIENYIKDYYKCKQVLERLTSILQEHNLEFESCVLFAEEYLNSAKMLEYKFIPRNIIDNISRVSSFFNNNKVKYFYDRKNYKDINKDSYDFIREESSNYVKEKNKYSIIKSVLEYLDNRVKIKDMYPDEEIQNRLKDILNEEINKETINDKIIETLVSYIESDADMFKQSLEYELLEELNEIVNDYCRNLEIGRLPKIKQVMEEFKINPNMFPVITTSCRTGYYLETLKTMISCLEIRKDDWKDDDESVFYIDAVYGFKSGKTKHILPYKGFVVSGILRGKQVNLGDTVYIGPHNGKLVRANIKSMHDNYRNPVTSIVNQERGCLGLEINDKEHKLFNYTNVKKGSIVTKQKDFEDEICWQFTCNIEINSTSKVTIKNGFKPIFYMGNIKQTVQFMLPHTRIIKSGESTDKKCEEDIIIRFTSHPEYINFNENNKPQFLISEGRTKGIGTITSILPIKDDPFINKKVQYTELTTENIQTKSSKIMPVL